MGTYEGCTVETTDAENRIPLPNGNSYAMEAIMEAMVQVRLLEKSREQSIVLTKLDEAYLWLKELETAGRKQ